LPKFKEIFKIIETELADSFEKIQYLPYIFFKLKCDDKKIEKNCIEILLKHNKEIKEFISNCFTTDESKLYYIVDIDFWFAWCEYVNWDNNNHENDNKPRLISSRIANAYGILNQGLVYLKDYVIVTEKMYELFKSWYICLGLDLPRYLIEKSIEKKVKGVTKKEKIYELEAYPIFIKVFNMQDVIEKSQSKSIDEIKEYLYTISQQVNGHVLQQYSKNILIKDLVKQLDIVNKFRLWVYHDSRFFNPNLEKSFEEEGLSDYVIIVIEYLKNSKWMSESFNLGDNSKKRMSMGSRALVGINNIGNSIYY
jgi:hypothetical protein